MKISKQPTKRIIEDTVSSVAGSDVLPLVRYLKDKKNISEFIIAESLSHEINAVRNMLYRLHQANLVSFTRKKDKQKGWYIYYWTFRPSMISTLVDKLEKDKLEGLRSRLHREKGVHFYKCNKGCIRLDFDQATDFDFKCPECGCIMDYEDNTKKITQIEQEIILIEKMKRMKRK
jgi:transcription initiation factor TFIIE subunit alpha